MAREGQTGGKSSTSHRTHTVEGREMPLPSLVNALALGYPENNWIVFRAAREYGLGDWSFFGRAGNLLEKVLQRPLPLVTNDPMPGYYM